MSKRNIGNQVIGSVSVNFPQANNKAVCRFQNLSGADLLISKFYGDWKGNGTFSSAKIKAVIYSDNAGVPGTLLATSDERIGTPYRWNPISFMTPLLVANNAFVWVGVISDTTLTSGACSNGGSIYYNSNTYSAGPTSTFGAATTAAFTYRMFVEGEDSTQSFGRRSIDVTGIAAGDGNYQPDREHADKVVLGGSKNVTVTSISTYVTGTTSATVKSRAAIYSDNNGYPGTKLGESVEVTGCTANSWLTLNMAVNTVLPPGTYWLAFIASENITTPVIPYSGSLIVDGPMTEATAFSSTYPTGSPVVAFNPASDGRGIDIYASYTDAVIVSAARPQVFVCA